MKRIRKMGAQQQQQQGQEESIPDVSTQRLQLRANIESEIEKIMNLNGFQLVNIPSKRTPVAAAATVAADEAVSLALPARETMASNNNNNNTDSTSATLTSASADSINKEDNNSSQQRTEWNRCIQLYERTKDC